MTRAQLLKQILNLTNKTPSQRLGLQARDVRQVDPSLAAPTDALLLVRAGAIVVSASSISMIILKNQCYFIVPQGADSILSTIIHKLVLVTQSAVEEENTPPLPFELRALEATLATVVSQMEIELSEMKKTINHALRALRDSPSDAKAQTQLFLGSGKLNSFLQRANAVVEAIEDTLQQPEDMAFMSLTRLDEGLIAPPQSPRLRPRTRMSGSVGSESGSGGKDPTHESTPRRRATSEEYLLSSVLHDEDVELLLENYLSDVKSLARRSQGLAWKLTSTSRIIEIELAAGRNRLLRYDVALQVVTVISAIAAMVAGLFGMNLKSGLENDDGVFWTVFGICIGSMVVLPVCCSFLLKNYLF